MAWWIGKDSGKNIPGFSKPEKGYPDHRVKLLDSLSQILQKSPGTRISGFMTGRPHIRSDPG
jgi:hypothetical protein